MTALRNEYNEALVALRSAEAKLEELRLSMVPVAQEVERLRMRCRELSEALCADGA
jgi:DNA repair ATPase RecN